MQYDDFQKLCEGRHSIRYFDQKPIPKGDVEKLLELGRLAPSIENLQPWHFHVVYNEDLRHKLAAECCYGNFIEGGSVFIVVTSDQALQREAQQTVWNPQELEYSCMAAMTAIMYGATSMGLGSCFVSLHHGTVHDILKFPHNEKVVGGLLLGYIEGQEAPAPHSRKPLESMITFYE